MPLAPLTIRRFTLCIGDNLRKNFGYAAFSKIYHELRLDTFFNNRQRHTKESYDANTIMKMLE